VLPNHRHGRSCNASKCRTDRSPKSRLQHAVPVTCVVSSWRFYLRGTHDHAGPSARSRPQVEVRPCGARLAWRRCKPLRVRRREHVKPRRGVVPHVHHATVDRAARLRPPWAEVESPRRRACAQLPRWRSAGHGHLERKRGQLRKRRAHSMDR